MKVLKPINPDLIPISEVRYVGGKAYQDFKMACPRCGGSGKITWSHVDNQICYKCLGARFFTTEARVYTEEELIKYHKRRETKNEKARQLRIKKGNEQVKEKYNESGDGFYIVALDNTYSIKEELKLAGAKFNGSMLKWYFLEPHIDYPTLHIPFSDLVQENEHGVLLENEDTFNNIRTLKFNPVTSEYYGKIGDKIDLILHLQRKFTIHFESSGYHMPSYKDVYIFIDKDGNEFKWLTTAEVEAEEGHSYKVTGTIKAHEEYRSVKQTILKRCKVREV